MLLRLVAGAGLFVVGYYLGKQVGMLDPVREELAKARRDRETAEKHAAKGDGRSEPDDPVT